MKEFWIFFIHFPINTKSEIKPEIIVMGVKKIRFLFSGDRLGLLEQLWLLTLRPNLDGI
jgi:hypothetical protein